MDQKRLSSRGRLGSNFRVVNQILHFLNKQLERAGEKTFYLCLLVFLALLAALFNLRFCLIMNHNFLLVSCDTAAYQNTLVNLLHGNAFRDTAFEGPNLLGLHTFFILLFLMPIYAFYPDPDLLYALQIIGAYSSVIPIFLIAFDRLKHGPSAFLIGLLTLVTPSFLVQVCSPFHPENWIPPALFWSYYFYLKDYRKQFWMSLFFAFFCGEISALFVTALGVALLFSTQDDEVEWRRQYGLRYLCSGIGWFLFAQLIVFPYMRTPDQQNLVSFKYPDWNVTTQSGLAVAVATHPSKALGMVFDKDRLHLYLDLFGIPILLAPLFRRSLLMLLPMPIFFLMSDQEFYLDFHVYYFGYAYIATIIALILFFKQVAVSSRVGLIFLGLALLWAFADNAQYTSIYQQIEIDQDAGLNLDILRILRSIPVEAGVYGPHRYSAIVSNRENMVMGDLVYDNDFDSMIEGRFSITQVHASQIDFIICDAVTDQTGPRKGWDAKLTEKRILNIANLVKTGRWRVYWGSPKKFIILCRADRNYQL